MSVLMNMSGTGVVSLHLFALIYGEETYFASASVPRTPSLSIAPLCSRRRAGRQSRVLQRKLSSQLNDDSQQIFGLERGICDRRLRCSFGVRWVRDLQNRREGCILLARNRSSESIAMALTKSTATGYVSEAPGTGTQVGIP